MAPAPLAEARPARPTPPTRDPHTSGYVTAKELPDAIVAPKDADGNFILGPTHNPAPEMTYRQSIYRSTRTKPSGILVGTLFPVGVMMSIIFLFGS
jgi:iron(III)-enterobactin esterase